MPPAPGRPGSDLEQPRPAPPPGAVPVNHAAPTERHDGPDYDESAAAAAAARTTTAQSMQRIHHDAFELLRFSETFPGGTTSMSSQGEASAAVDAALLAMAKSSDGIATELRHMTALAARADDAAASLGLPRTAARPGPHGAAAHGKRPHGGRRASGDMSPPSRRRRKSNTARMTCHECNRAETPQWRPGPDGPNTLCNVCGLLYAKRQVRKKGSSKDGSKGGSKGGSREDSREDSRVGGSCMSWPS